MRRYLTGFLVAAATAVMPALVLAGDHEVAEQIANDLRQSGQMSDDARIGVKFQNGTAFLRGRVSSEAEADTAARLALETPGVGRVDYNGLVVGSPDERSAPVATRDAAKTRRPGLAKRLEAAFRGNSDRAERVPTSYTQANAEQTSAEEPQELPRRMVAPARTAMQPAVRGPVAYGANGAPVPTYSPATARAGVAPARYDQPCMPNYAWPSYAAYPNYAAVTYPKQYSPTAWPYIGPFYPYPQVPMGWRKVTLEWDGGWWFLDFKDQPSSPWHR
ncbi:MAG: BON domain-containing protein [Thermoguttaceae bacterium]